jgi:5'-3' exonuclease
MNILLVDGTNVFLRNYAAVPSLDLNGNPNGGVYGTLLALRKTISLTKPDKIVISWDAPGGSRKRRSIVESYKLRKTPCKTQSKF